MTFPLKAFRAAVERKDVAAWQRIRAAHFGQAMDVGKLIITSHAATALPSVSRSADPRREIRRLKAAHIRQGLAMPVKAQPTRTAEDRRIAAKVQRARSRVGLADERLIAAEAAFRLLRW
jgi:hypothetical protein